MNGIEYLVFGVFFWFGSRHKGRTCHKSDITLTNEIAHASAHAYKLIHTV